MRHLRRLTLAVLLTLVVRGSASAQTPLGNDRQKDQLARGTDAQIAALTAVLAGEPIFRTDHNDVCIGNGTTCPYILPNLTAVQALIAALTYTSVGAAPLSHAHAASDLTSGTLNPARLGSGSGGSAKYLREDSTWQTLDLSAYAPLSHTHAESDITNLVSDLAGKQAADADLLTYAGIPPSVNVQSVLAAADYGAIRTLLGLVIGANVQAQGNYITALTGDVTASGPGSVSATIANDAVTDAKLRNAAALSVIGRSVNSIGDPADIAASSDGDVLRRSGATLGFGAVPEASVTNLVSDLAGKQATGNYVTGLTGDVTASGPGSVAATIATAAVSLAKMADLAQDQFIGRTTASTGVPQTATITSAARTVLDDTTVGAMLSTLGGQPSDADLTAVAAGCASGTVIVGGTPVACSSTPTLTSLTVTGTLVHPKGTFTSSQVTGAYPAATIDEVELRNDLADGNTLAARNTNVAGFSAFTVRSSDNYEKFAMGWGNASTLGFFRGSTYIQSWSGVATGGAVPLFQITHDGDYGVTGSGFRFYRRISLAATTSDFDIWRLIPDGTTQESVLNIVAATGKTTIAPNATGADALVVRNRSVSGYSGLALNDSSDALKFVFGYGNASASHDSGKTYIYTYNGGAAPGDLNIGRYLGAADPSLTITGSNGYLTIADARHFVFSTSTGTQHGTAANQKQAFYGATPVVQPTALTAQLTTVTFTAPTPDYALQTVQLAGYGFASADEGNTLLSVVANLQTRVAELNTKLSALGLIAP